MKYSLAIYKNHYDYIEINNFSYIAEHEGLEESSLKDIITFTQEFENEKDLIETLIEAQMLPLAYANGTPAILSYKSKDANPKKLPYDVSYNKEKDFFDISYLRAYYMDKFKDIKFIEKFIQRYYDELRPIPVYKMLFVAIKDFYVSNTPFYDLEFKDQLYLKDSMDFFVTTYTKKRTGNNIYQPSISKIRELAMFAINFERITTADYVNEKFDINEYTKNLKILLDHYISLTENPDQSEEVYDYNMNMVTKLQEELDTLNSKDFTRGRRKNDETTSN